MREQVYWCLLYEYLCVRGRERDGEKGAKERRNRPLFSLTCQSHPSLFAKEQTWMCLSCSVSSQPSTVCGNTRNRGSTRRPSPTAQGSSVVTAPRGGEGGSGAGAWRTLNTAEDRGKGGQGVNRNPSLFWGMMARREGGRDGGKEGGRLIDGLKGTKRREGAGGVLGLGLKVSQQK